MKKILSTAVAMLLLLTMVLSLASCGSTFGAIKANFEKAGYELVDIDEELENKLTAAGINLSGEIETEDGVITYTVHVFMPKEEEDDGDQSLGDLIGGVIDGVVNALSFAVVYEFGSDADLAKAMAEDENIMNALEDAQESDFVNGNCLLMTLNPENIKIFKGEVEAK